MDTVTVTTALSDLRPPNNLEIIGSAALIPCFLAQCFSSHTTSEQRGEEMFAEHLGQACVKSYKRQIDRQTDRQMKIYRSLSLVPDLEFLNPLGFPG